MNAGHISGPNRHFKCERKRLKSFFVQNDKNHKPQFVLIAQIAFNLTKSGKQNIQLDLMMHITRIWFFDQKYRWEIGGFMGNRFCERFSLQLWKLIKFDAITSKRGQKQSKFYRNIRSHTSRIVGYFDLKAACFQNISIQKSTATNWHFYRSCFATCHQKTLNDMHKNATTLTHF